MASLPVASFSGGRGLCSDVRSADHGAAAGQEPLVRGDRTGSLLARVSQPACGYAESANDATKIVLSVLLSVFVNPDKKIKISHFPITEELGQYSFEGEAFDSIRELLDYHIATKEVITAKSKAVIIRGAKRTERPFTHDDVKQGKRLGKGNFGDVFMGTLEDGTLCALKTCKESVPNPERFLEEADTLNQYQHPNIVQIYGVVKRAPVSRWPTLS